MKSPTTQLPKNLTEPELRVYILSEFDKLCVQFNFQLTKSMEKLSRFDMKTGQDLLAILNDAREQYVTSACNLETFKNRCHEKVEVTLHTSLAKQLDEKKCPLFIPILCDFIICITNLMTVTPTEDHRFFTAPEIKTEPTAPTKNDKP